MRKVLILHGWDDNGTSYWIPQLKNLLQSKIFTVINPDLPNSHKPILKDWLKTAKQAVGSIGKEDTIIAYSSGFTLALQLLAELDETNKIKCLIGLAPFDSVLTNDKLTIDLYSIPIDYKKIRNKAEFFNLIASDNDPYIPLDKFPRRIKEELNAELEVIHAGLINKAEHYKLIAPIIIRWLTGKGTVLF